MRKKATLQENMLWQELRNRQLGPKFKRQYSIGRYILDFCCIENKLIIEVDGGIHDKNREYDAVRDKYFTELGFKVLRFTNEEVEESMKEVLEKIKSHLAP